MHRRTTQGNITHVTESLPIAPSPPVRCPFFPHRDHTKVGTKGKKKMPAAVCVRLDLYSPRRNPRRSFPVHCCRSAPSASYGTTLSPSSYGDGTTHVSVAVPPPLSHPLRRLRSRYRLVQSAAAASLRRCTTLPPRKYARKGQGEVDTRRLPTLLLRPTVTTRTPASGKPTP